MSYCDERPVYPVDDLPWVIPVGVQTSKGVEEIGFNVSAWLDKWPDMTFEVWPTRPTETAAYPAVCQLIGDVLVWYVSDADTAFEGLGTVEVVGIAEGIRKPSGPCTTEIKKTSLGVTQEPPEGIKPYYEDMMEAAKTIREGLDGLNADLVGSDGYGGLYIVTCNGQKPNRTQAEIRAAVQARKTVLLRAGTRVYTYFQETQSSNYDEAAAGKTCPTFVRPARQEDGGLRYYEVQVHEDDTITDRGEIGKTPNPKKLKLTGAVEAEYDGSEKVEIYIPSGVSDPGTAHLQLVSDENGKAVWVDRTHYAETNAVELLPATALTDTGEGTFILSTSPTHDLVIGTIATVTYNGTAYACEVAPYAEEDVIVGAMVGNFAIAGGEGGNADAPFIALILSTSNAAEQGYGGVVVPTDGATSITISITGTVFEYHKLDNAYLDLDYVPKSNPKTEASPVPLRLSPGGKVTELNSDAAKKILKSSKIRVRNINTSEEWICKPVKWMYEDQSVKVLFGDADLTGEYPFAIRAQINYTGASVGATGAGILTVDKYTEKQTFFLYIYQEENCVPLTMLPEFPVLRLGMMGYNDDNKSVILSAHEDGILYMYSPGTGTVQTVGAVLTSPSGRKYKLSVSDDGALSTTLMS